MDKQLNYNKLSARQQFAVRKAYPNGVNAFDFGIHTITRKSLCQHGWTTSNAFDMELTPAGRAAYETWLAEQKATVEIGVTAASPDEDCQEAYQEALDLIAVRDGELRKIRSENEALRKKFYHGR